MKKIICAVLALSLLLGGMPALAAGEGQPRYSGLALREDGSLLATDVGQNTLWVLAEGEEPALLAGRPGLSFYRDGKRENAGFVEPWAISPFLEGWAVSDAGADVVRLVTDAAVYTLTGSGSRGRENGAAPGASFQRPTGLATDEAGSLYIADTGNGIIRKLETNGTVSDYCTGLSDPTGLCWQGGVLYVAETGKNRILRVRDGAAETVAGLFEEAEDGDESYGGYVDGPVDSARFDHPLGVAVGSGGTVYVADTGNRAVRMIREGRVYTLARSSVYAGVPVEPRALVLDGETLTVADAFAGRILKLDVREKDFSDVSDSALAADLREAALRGLVNGYADGSFAPDAPVSRAALAVMLARLRQYSDGTAHIYGNVAFADLPEEDASRNRVVTWFSDAARWAVENDLLAPVDGTFAYAAPVDGETVGAALEAYAALLGYDPALLPQASEEHPTRAGVVGLLLDVMEAYGL